ncbi:hypothetical protein HanRHA438_Chr02g0084171 [Helianthus annuus]|nr:hypothetical protein HanRHA438_Chr02g0084171 [Helianthus annuus]
MIQSIIYFGFSGLNHCITSLGLVIFHQKFLYHFKQLFLALCKHFHTWVNCWLTIPIEVIVPMRVSINPWFLMHVDPRLTRFPTAMGCSLVLPTVLTRCLGLETNTRYCHEFIILFCYVLLKGGVV